MSVWNCFIQKHGSPYYPSATPANTPFDKFICMVCGKEIELQMAGAQDIRERSFEDQAFFKLADHLAEHIVCKGRLTNHAIDLKVRERIARKQFIKEAVGAGVCPECGEDLHTESDEEGPIEWRCKNAACSFRIRPTDV